LRRARAFKTYRRWHPLFARAAAEFGLYLGRAKIEPARITLFTADRQEVTIPLAADGTFDPVDFGGPSAAKFQRGKPFSDERVWHLGIVLAARALGLDLGRAEVDLARRTITLTGANGLRRIIPVDADGCFPIDWALTVNDPRLTRQSLEELLTRDDARSNGGPLTPANPWSNHIVVIGSTATGNDLTDLGATPLARETVLMSKHWNVANAVLTGRFIHRTTLAQDCLIIALLGALAAALSLRLRALPALAAVLAAAAAYLGLAALVYVQYRVWMPLFLPLVGAMAVQYAGLLTWRVIFEQDEKRRVRSVFAKIVAPEVVHELLEAERVSLGGTRCEVTVFFADVRGFTAFTDESREMAGRIAREGRLSPAAIEAHFDREARETLETVNTYLALIADKVKEHAGTLDKYIGDCVMAFWNAPVPNPRHALACVRAAIEAQRAIDALNRRRAETNEQRERENTQRVPRGEPPLPPLPVLSLGTGINTGPVVVGLMGSEAHILNYTVFGREVNLASRLEALSGSGRILIGEATHAALRRDDPALAVTCVALPPVTVKGIREAVNVYEVPWRPTNP
jgi:class 3 adenylate cyclase